jgi:hypothetical protein
MFSKILLKILELLSFNRRSGRNGAFMMFEKRLSLFMKLIIKIDEIDLVDYIFPNKIIICT